MVKKERVRNVDDLQTQDAVNSSENVTAPWDRSSNSTYTIKNGFLTEGYCGDGLIASAL